MLNSGPDTAYPESIEKKGGVQGIPLHGPEASAADYVPQLFFGGAVGGSGGLDHILLEHHRTHVIATEAQAKLQHLQSLRYPAGLHILHIVQVQTGDSKILQVLDRSGLIPL